VVALDVADCTDTCDAVEAHGRKAEQVRVDLADRAALERELASLVVVGKSAGDVSDRLAAYLAAGADDLMVQPVPEARGGDPRRTIAALSTVEG
jgi:hypothetical protein